MPTPRLVRAAALRIAGLGALVAVAGCEFLPPSPLAKLEPAQALAETEGTYLQLGRHYLSQGLHDLAHDAFVRSIRIEGANAAAFAGAGVAAERQGLLTAARRHFERAVRLAPSSPVAHNNLGAVLYRTGEYHAARQAFETAFALSSGTNRTAQQNIGITSMAIAQAEANEVPIMPNPVPLQRMGSGEYTLGKLGKNPATGVPDDVPGGARDDRNDGEHGEQDE